MAGSALPAQVPLPTTYSYSEDPALSIVAPTLVTLHRDGAKELIEQVIPPSPGRPKEFRSHILYDFQTHKIYTQVLSEPGAPCSVMEYSSPAAPAELGGGSSGEKTGFNVTGVQLQPIANYNGACPAHVKMTATITTDGPGTVWYQFGAGQQNPGKTVKFAAAGTQTVSDMMTFIGDPKYGDDIGASAAVMAVMEDKQGGHALFGTSSNNSDFSVHCRR